MDINQIVIVKPGHDELQKSTMVEKLEPFEVPKYDSSKITWVISVRVDY